MKETLLPQQHLQALAADVDRLLAAGATVAAADENLRRRVQALQQLAQQVPALARIATAAERVLSATGAAATVALLDLLLLMRQVRASMASAGASGLLEGLAPSGPWQTRLRADDLEALAQTLTVTGTPSARLEVLSSVLGRAPLADLRLLPPLFRALEDRSAELARLVATRFLPEFGPTLAPELGALIDPRGEQADAFRLLALCAVDRVTGLERCRAALREGSLKVRAVALPCLAELAPPGETVAAALAHLGSTRNADVRRGALQALKTVAPEGQEAIPALVGCLADSSAEAHTLAREALARMGAAGVPPLTRALRDPDQNRQIQAALTLRDIGPAAAAAVPDLLWALDPENIRPVRAVRSAVVAALGTIGPAARSALPLLEQLLARTQAHPGQDVAPTLVAGALAKISGDVDRWLPILVRALREPLAALGAVWELDSLGPAARAAAPALLAAFQDGGNSARHKIALALVRVGADPRQAVPSLCAVARQNTDAWYVRQAALHALREYGAAAVEALPLLKQLEQSHELWLREAAGAARAAIEAKVGSP